jgi:serine/threonine protein phosphatase PrpC
LLKAYVFSVHSPHCHLQEKKRIFNEKIASNPFSFLDAEDGADEEPEEAPQPQPSNTKENAVSKKKKKRSKGGEGAAAAAAAASGSAPTASQHDAPAAAEERDGDAEEASGRGGDGDTERIHAELQPVEEARDFSEGTERDAAGQANESVEGEACLQLKAALLTRRGVDHENEDRALMGEIADMVSAPLKAALLRNSRSKQMPVFAVFDGHGGDGASEHAKNHLVPNVVEALERQHAEGAEGDDALREAYVAGFARTEEQLRERAGSTGDRSGTCAVCVVVWEQDGVFTLHAANLGDCRAMVARRDDSGKLVGVRVTDDQRAVTPDEKRRIEAAGTHPLPSTETALPELHTCLLTPRPLLPATALHPPSPASCYRPLPRIDTTCVGMPAIASPWRPSLLCVTRAGRRAGPHCASRAAPLLDWGNR